MSAAPMWRLLLLAAALMGATAACSGGADLAPYLGTWTYVDGQIDGTCADNTGSMVLRQSLTIRRGTSSDLELEIGCRCRLGLDLQGDHAALTERQLCQQNVSGVLLVSSITKFDFRLTGGGAMGAFGGSSVMVRPDQVIPCESFAGSGSLVREPMSAPDCGADDTAVGVIPVVPDEASGIGDCPAGPGRDGIVIVLDSEELPTHAACTEDTSAAGQGAWVDPQAPKEVPACPGARGDLILFFCRVDGAAFAPLAGGATRSEQGYAVLKLGPSCPPGSVTVTKTIDTEAASATKPNTNNFVGDIAPSTVDKGGTFSVAVLDFCYFGGTAAGPTKPMADFPDLAFPYAVFHDFDGPQPSWVMTKRWQHSDDEAESNQNSYSGADPDIQAAFQKIVDNDSGTTFDMARVR